MSAGEALENDLGVSVDAQVLGRRCVCGRGRGVGPPGGGTEGGRGAAPERLHDEMEVVYVSE